MKLIIFGAVLVAAVIFGFWFWGEFTYNQDQLASPAADTADQTPLPPPSPNLDAADVTSIEAELNAVDLNELDAEASEMDLSGL
jgi:hypothetical protein